uniref:ATP6V1F neighbor n=1 Tax=Pelusios castaneus TaxID=367368 RepID=A0A8C8SM17_9SAUR
MARQLGVSTLQQDFWKEAYLKELTIRCCWHQRYGAALKAKREQLRQRRPAAKEPLKLPAIQPPAPEAPKPPPEPAGPVGVPEGTMKPVAPKVRQLLYQGISHDGEGRRRYLHQRQACPPEDKYYIPITTNFIYGWQMGDSVLLGCRIESFFRKNGVFSLLDPCDVAM